MDRRFTTEEDEDEILRAIEAAQEDDTGEPETEFDNVTAHDSSFEDATPRTLYVRRDVVNVEDIRKWAQAQGLPDLIPDLHVTIMYSRTPVDWMKVGDNWNGDEEGRIKIKPGGVRILEPMGNGEVIALLFTSSELSWRHEAIKRDADASWDWPDYQPHITLFKVNGSIFIPPEPYRGEIILGPEIFEEVKEDK